MAGCGNYKLTEDMRHEAVVGVGLVPLPGVSQPGTAREREGDNTKTSHTRHCLATEIPGASILERAIY